MENSRSNFLGTEKVEKLFIKLVIPTVIAQIINLLYNIVDRIYIGHINGMGNIALTGVGLCMPIIIILSAFAQLVGVGGAPRTSMFMGKNDYDSAEEILGSCTAFLVILGIILTLSFRFTSEKLLISFGASKNTLPYALDYINIYVLGTIFVMISMALNLFITSQGYTKVSMMTVIIGGVLNIILDPIFIFAFNMGVKGAAIATILSQAVSSIWCIKFLTSDKTNLKIRKKYFKVRWKVLMPCIFLGLSPFVMQVTECAVSICFNRSLVSYGGDIAVGSMTIFTTIMQFVFLPINGFSQGAQPITSFNYGANNLERMKKSIKLLITVSVTYSVLLWLGIKFFPDGFIKIFTNDSNLINYTKEYIGVFFAMLFIMGFQASCQSSFLAIGNAKISLFLALLRKVILLIPLIFILPNLFEDKIMAVFLAEPISDTIASIITTTMFMLSLRKIFKKGKNSKQIEKPQNVI